MRYLFIGLVFFCVNANIIFGLTLFSDPSQSRFNFEAKQLRVMLVKGSIDGFSGLVVLNEANQIERIEARLDANSVGTDNSVRDRRLKKEPFFDSIDHPHITFLAQGPIELTAKSIEGVLTVKGVKHKMKVPVQFDLNKSDDLSKTSLRARTGSFVVNRFDLGFKSHALTISKDVTLDIDFLLVPLKNSR
jgi:polyisoprenoid-binding protein YceI